MKLAFFSAAAYRLDFFVGLLVAFAGAMLSPLFILLIYDSGAAIGDYGVYQVYLIQGVYLLASGLGSVLFFDIVPAATFRVREGTLDVLLLKPAALLSMLIASSYNNGGLANLLGGALLIALSLMNLPAPTPLAWLKFLPLFASGMVVLFSFSVILAALGIVWLGNSRLLDIYGTLSRFASYPVTIFSKALRVLLSYLIPVAMLGFFPASVLMGIPADAAWLSVLSCAAFCCLSLLFWRHMIKRYTSAGG